MSRWISLSRSLRAISIIRRSRWQICRDVPADMGDPSHKLRWDVRSVLPGQIVRCVLLGKTVVTPTTLCWDLFPSPVASAAIKVAMKSVGKVRWGSLYVTKQWQLQTLLSKTRQRPQLFSSFSVSSTIVPDYQAWYDHKIHPKSWLPWLPESADNFSPKYWRRTRKLSFFQFFYLGKPSFKKIYFAKKFHKRGGVIWFSSSIFYFKCSKKSPKKISFHKTPTGGLPFYETFSQNRFFKMMTSLIHIYFLWIFSDIYW